MLEIRDLEDQLEKALSLKNLQEAKLASEPSSFAYQMSLESLEKHVRELRQELFQLKKKREKEIIELRLIGGETEQATIPLEILGKIATRLSEVIYSAAFFSKTHSESTYIPADLKSVLNLRFVGTAPGSVRIFLTGNLVPNLFGDSLLENCLQNTLDLLFSNNADEIAYHLSKLGKNSGRKIRGLLKTFLESDLEVEIRWDTPTGQPLFWKGEKDKIQVLKETLDKITFKPAVRINVHAKLVMVNLRGQFEMKEEKGRAYKGHFPMEILGQIQACTIGKDVVAEIEKTEIVNEASNDIKTSFTLISIKPDDTPKTPWLFEAY